MLEQFQYPKVHCRDLKQTPFLKIRAVTSEIIEDALAMLDKPRREVGQFFGPSCHLLYGLPQTIHLIANYKSYVEGVCMNNSVGGDNAGRSTLFGAILAALYGVDTENGPTRSWREKLSKRQEITELLAKL